MKQENIQIVRQVMQAVVERNLEVLIESYAPDVEIHDAESLPYGGTYRGHDGLIRHAQAYLAAWAPLQTDADRNPEPEFIGEQDRVAVLWRQKATGRDGTRFDQPAISLFELRGGKVTKLHMFHYDAAAARRFLEDQARTDLASQNAPAQ